MSAIAQCVKKKKKKRSQCLFLLWVWPEYIHTKRVDMWAAEGGTAWNCACVFLSRTCFKSCLIKRERGLNPFLILNASLARSMWRYFEKKKKKRRRRRKKEKKSQTDPRSDRSLFCCAWSEWTSLSSSPSHSDQLQLSSNTQTKE